MKFEPSGKDYNFLQQVIQFEEEVVSRNTWSHKRRWRCLICGCHLYSRNALDFERALGSHEKASPSCFSLVIPVYEEPA